MSEPAWKGFERRIFRRLGGDRRGAQTSRGRQGLSDNINIKGLSAEAKLYLRPSFQIMLDACHQAEANKEEGNLPIAIVKRKRDNDNNALVIMRFEVFEEAYKSFMEICHDWLE